MSSYQSDSSELKVKVVSEIIRELKLCVESSKGVNLNHLKNRICKKYKLTCPPKFTEIIAAVPSAWKKNLVPYLRVKPCRTASGIAIVAVMCKPHRCPHIEYTGHICVYCPGGPDSDFDYSTQSYTGYEPTSMRAIRVRYDPYRQVRGRVEQLEGLGHNVEKVEFILMGGTFMCLPDSYRNYFIMNLHDGLSGNRSRTLEEAIHYSERSAFHRCVGLTIETRPDYCQRSHLLKMLSYGCTRLEIGVQSIYEDVALDTNRGHTVEAVCDAFTKAKNKGFKITTHMMPDLPNVGYERDLYQFEEFFQNPRFRADGLKIYPTLVIRGTGLYELWKTKRYQNYSSAQLTDLITQLLALVPPWVRVYRIQRDIPMPLVSSTSVQQGHLRDEVMARMKGLGLSCRDIRSREVGIKEIHDKVKPNQLEPIRRDYYANEGWECFLSYEDPQSDILVALLRLRLYYCSDDSTQPESAPKAIIRELHVYGEPVAVSERDTSKFQHRGFGSLLVDQAEQIALHEHGATKMAIISAVGTRNYYRKLGYYLEGFYMVKNLANYPLDP